MEHSSRLFSVRTYALAFALVLSPAFFQVDYSCERGNTFLLSLELEVSGQDQIVNFSTTNRSYAVTTSSSTAVLRVVTQDPASIATYRWFVDGTAIGPAIEIGAGGGEVTVDVPDGQTALYVGVRAPEGAFDNYIVDVDRIPAVSYACSEQGILQALSDGGGPHYFDCVVPTTVETESLIIIGNDVILDGQGLLTVSGKGTHQLFVIWSNVEFIGMTLTGGAHTGQGGAVRNGGTLTLTRCTVSGNTGSLGAGIYSEGELTLRSTTVSGNATPAGNYGGGGIAMSYTGTLTVIDSTISGNTSGVGGGIVNNGVGTITNSTISGNSATYQGGGGIYNSAGHLILTNSTVSGNTAAVRGSGIDNAGSGGTASLTLINTTVFGNTGGELGTAIGNFGGSMTFLNSVIEGSCYISGGEPLPVAAYTVESPGETCVLPAGQGNQMNVSAAALGLGPLQDNGGATLTHAPSASSVTVDRIPLAECVDAAGGPLDADQRGDARPLGPRCDSGAVEGDCPYCNDFNECTVNSCDPVTLACTHTPVVDDAPCALGASLCIAGVCGSCAGVSCSPDTSECTADVCDSETGVCQPPLPDGIPCSTDNGECVAGVCEGGVVQISAQGEVTARPVVAVATDGRAHALWEQEHGSLRITYGATHSSGSGWTEPFSFGVGGVNPRIVSAPNGHVVAVWADASGSVYGRSFKNDAWDWPQRLDLSVVTDDPQVAVDWNGNATAVWTHGGYLYATQYSPIGGWRSPGTVDQISVGATVPQVAMDARGNALAVWLDDADDVQAAHYTPGYGWHIVRLVGEEVTDARDPQVVMDPEGGAIAIWQDWQDGPVIYQNRFTHFGGQSGGSWGDPELFETVGSAFWGQIAMDGVGNAMVLWANQGGIWAKRITRSPPLEPELINDDEGSPYMPKIAMDPRGNAVAVWSASDGGNDNLWANVYRVNHGWDGPWKIHATPSQLRNYDVAIDNDGNAMVVFEQDQSIWAQNFSIGPADWKFSCDEQGIRDAIAEGGGTHQFACNGAQTVTTDNEIVIDNRVTLDGEGNLTIDGQGAHRVFSVTGSGRAHLARMTVTGGHTTEDGGGIQAETCSWLTLSNSTVSFNHADGLGGGVHNKGSMTVANSTISDNTAGDGGGGLHILDDADCSTGWPTQIFLGSSTVMANAADGELGGGILNVFGTVILENSSVLYNRAAYGGGIATLNDVVGGTPNATLQMRKSTVAWNPVTVEASAIWNNARLYGFRGNIIQGECVTTTAPEESWYNIESPHNTCLLSTSKHNLYNVAMTSLHLLATHGQSGPTFTAAPAIPSEAIDRFAGGVGPSCAGADQRGVPRPQRGWYCDVGAVEVRDVELRVDWTVEPLTIEGSALPFGLTIDNHNGYLQWVILRARITQGTASRDAGELEPDCGGTPGDVESGVCSFTMPLAASNAVPGSGTLVPGPATVQLDLQLYEGSGGTGELIEVLDTAQFSTTLVAPP